VSLYFKLELPTGWEHSLGFGFFATEIFAMSQSPFVGCEWHFLTVCLLLSLLFLQVVTKKKIKLSKRFKCPFCANEDVVECKMDFKAGIGSLSCRLCGAAYQMPIHHLHEPIDVFSEWLDDCEAAQGGGAAAAAAAAPVGDGHDDDEDDDALPESSGMGRKKSTTSSSAKNSNNKRSIDLGDEDSEDDDDE
jgi:transcription elongation factor Elf1